MSAYFFGSISPNRNGDAASVILSEANDLSNIVCAFARFLASLGMTDMET